MTKKQFIKQMEEKRYSLLDKITDIDTGDVIRSVIQHKLAEIDNILLVLKREEQRL